MKSTLVAFVVAMFAMSAFAAEGEMTNTAPVSAKAEKVITKKAKKHKKKGKKGKKKAAEEAAPAAPATPAAGQ